MMYVLRTTSEPHPSSSLVAAPEGATGAQLLRIPGNGAHEFNSPMLCFESVFICIYLYTIEIVYI